MLQKRAQARERLVDVLKECGGVRLDTEVPKGFISFPYKGFRAIPEAQYGNEPLVVLLNSLRDNNELFQDDDSFIAWLSSPADCTLEDANPLQIVKAYTEVIHKARLHGKHIAK